MSKRLINLNSVVGRMRFERMTIALKVHTRRIEAT